MHAMRLDERHRRGDRAEQERRDLSGDGGAVPAVPRLRVKLADALHNWTGIDELRGLLEIGPPGRIDRLRRGEVLREELLNEPGVEVLEPLQSLTVSIATADAAADADCGPRYICLVRPAQSCASG